MFDKIQHAGYRVADLDVAVAWFEKAFGAKNAGGGPLVNRPGGRNAFVRFGQVEMEIVQPPDAASLPPNRLLLDHVGYVVPDIAKAVPQLAARGFKFVADSPYTNIMGQQVLYFDTATTNGVRIHLTQLPEQPNNVGIGEGLPVERIVHAGYLVSRLEDAIAWYIDKFDGEHIGGRTSPAGRRNAFVNYGRVQVELIQPEDKSGLPPTGYAMDHVGYVLADIGAGISECRARGLKFVADEPMTNPVGQTLLYFDTSTTMGTRIHLTQLPD